jgi:hypothetical protein
MRKLLFIILLFFSFKSYSQTIDQAYTYIKSRAVYYFGSNYTSQAQISLEGNIFKIFNMNTGSYLSGVTAMFSTIDSCTYISSRTGLTVNSQRYYDSRSGGSMVCAEICLSGSFSAPGTCVYPTVTCPDGSTAANLSACPIQCTLPQIRDASTNTCYTPPPVCNAGDHKALYVVSGQFPAAGTPPTLILRKNADGTESVTRQPTTVMFGGCTYTIPNTPSLGCQTTSTGVIGCKVTATATGQSIEGAQDTALDASISIPNSPTTCTAPLQWDTDHCAVPSASAGCYTVMSTNGANEICPETPQHNCGTVNGSQLCITDSGLTSNGYPAAIVDGKVLANTTNENGQINRCFTSNSGKVVCINPPVVSGTPLTNDPFVYLQTDETNPTIIPFSSDPQETSKTVTKTSPTGSRQEVVTTTTDIIDSTPNVVQNNYDAAGQLTSSTPISTGTGAGTATDTPTTTKDGTVSASPGIYNGTGIFGTGTGTGSSGGKGRFYTSTGKTVASVTSSFMETATKSPLLAAGQDIFKVNFPQSAACGDCDFSIPAVMGMNSIEMLPFCASWMPAFWAFISAALRVVTVFMAVRIMITPTF